MSFPTNCYQFLRCRQRLIDLSAPVVMGIINATPDSFYAGSRNAAVEDALRTAGEMLEEGAAMLDVGGYSSRPGADVVPEEEELDRVTGIITALHRTFPEAVISIDTFRGEVARQALDAGAGIVNDISAGEDRKLLEAAATFNAPLVLMHKKGMPADMQQKPAYENVLTEVFDYLLQRTLNARQAGVKDIILDPGFGFGKNLTHNYSLAKHLDLFGLTGIPVLAGISRKSMIQKVVKEDAIGALHGTIALHMPLLEAGARILRVHDVKAAVETIRIFRQLQSVK